MEKGRDNFIPLAQRPRPSILAAEVLVLVAAAGLWLSSLFVELIHPGTGAQLLADLCYYGPFVLAPAAFYCLRRGGLSEGLRLNPLPLYPALMAILLGIMSVYAASAVNSLWGLLLNALGLSEPFEGVSLDAAGSLLPAVLHTAALPAVCEELLFRGVVFSAFERRGTAVSIGVSSMLFAMMHGNLYGLPAYLLVGAISAFIVFAVDSVYAGMLYHTVYNAAILVILNLLSRQGDIPADAAADGGLIASAALNFLMVGLGISMLLNALNLRRRMLGIEALPPAPDRMTMAERLLLLLLCLALIGSMIAVQALSAGGAA